MPIFEYRCADCGALTSLLVLAAGDEEALRCRVCDGRSLRRVPSAFAVHKTEAQRLGQLDAGRPDDGFYRDRRNIGLAAKKRAREAGVELGSRFDEAVEKARSARSIEDLAG